MARKQISSRRLRIDKANASMVIVLAAAVFVTVFSLVASRALLSQRSYQSRVITEKKKALTQLKANNDAATQLVDAYKVFVANPENIIGGSSTGTGDRDGDNAKIVLDALPSKYDFPAFATGIENILKARNYKITTISGTDDELSQSQATQTAVQPVEMPLGLAVSGNFTEVQSFLETLQASIRPLKIDSLTINGTDDALSVTVASKSFYQPKKTFKITYKEVK